MTDTIQTFDKRAYVSAIENYDQWMQLSEKVKENPNDPQLKQIVGAVSDFADPSVFMQETPDVVQSYVNGYVSDFMTNVRETTVNNSKTILTAIVDGFDNPGQSIGLIGRTGLMPFEGDDRYKSATDAHKAVAIAQAIIKGKNVDAAAADIVDEYGMGLGVQDAVKYHAGANPEGLINIYASTVFGVKIGKFNQEFARNDGALKKTHLANYANYIFTNADDNSEAALAIAGMAHEKYSKE